MNTSADTHQRRREFAVAIVSRLRDAGHQAYWAGGCVRDQLLGLTPKDYDVATDAPPVKVRQIFGHRKTIAVGVAFGVITVVGPADLGNVEIATFRQDVGCADGRHPDSVVFSTPEHDAQRRDFTINGLFYDPLESQVIDFVGGQADLEKKVLRAIGDPRERFAEDKLRMLRAVRFTITYDLEMDPSTFAAIRQHAGELVVVSAERVAEELRRMLVSPRRAAAISLLFDSGLLEIVLPEIQQLHPSDVPDPGVPTRWERTLSILGRFEQPTFAVCLAGLLREFWTGENASVARVVGRWRLSRADAENAEWFLRQEQTIRSASTINWPRLQRVLIDERIRELLVYTRAVCAVVDGREEEIDFCLRKLQLPADDLNPVAILSGNDLQNLGIVRGPIYRILLTLVRDAQLNKEIASRAEAEQLVQDFMAQNLDKQKPTP